MLEYGTVTAGMGPEFQEFRIALSRSEEEGSRSDDHEERNAQRGPGGESADGDANTDPSGAEAPPAPVVNV